MSKHKEFIKKYKREKFKILGLQLLCVFLFFGLWEVLTSVKIIDEFLVSKPSAILKLLYDYIVSKEIFIHIGISLYETLLGLIIGTFLGILFAIILWFSKTLTKICEPFLVVLNALPKTALAPILIIWAGTGIKGIVVVAVSLSLIMTVISAHNFFIHVDEDKIKMLKTFNANKFQILFKLILPANIMNLLSIIKINIGMSWVGVIVGEFLVSRFGIGYLVVYGGQVFKLDLVMMGVFILAILAYLMYLVITIIEKVYRKKDKRGIYEKKNIYVSSFFASSIYFDIL